MDEHCTITGIPEDIAFETLLKNIQCDPGEIKEIGRGMFSVAYEFCQNGRCCILRIRKSDFDFLKDRFLHGVIDPDIILTPSMLQIGTHRGYHFAIHEKIPGLTIDRFEESDKPEIIDRVVRKLFDLQRTKANQLHNYGLFDENGIGRCGSWKEELRIKENHKIYYDFEAINRNLGTFSGEIAQITVARDDLLPHVPNRRNLVHGDLGCDHVLVEEENVGIIDWAEARIGDYVYDIAYFDFWRGTEEMKHSLERISDEKHLDERYRCYQLTIGIGEIHIAGHFNDQDRIRRSVEKAIALIGGPKRTT